ncbi:MAG TPA: hypothetical protein VMV25_13520 [Steroidobacteraceae bacterium]|nr:hypothetical protein [Steroidobacteraceae bacterium]
MNIRGALILVLTALASCATQMPAHHGRGGSRIFFDETTGSTLSVVDKPLIFARNRSDVAAFARDYATLVALEVDLSGRDSEYLLLYRWSTVDPRMSPPPGPNEGELHLFADGRLIDFRPLPELPISLSRRRLLQVPDHGDVIAYAYRVDLDTLRFIARSRDLRLRMPQEPLDLPFKLWADARGALAQFAGPSGTP